MAFINPNWYLALLFSVFLFFLWRRIYTRSVKNRIILRIVGILFGGFALLFPLAYISDFIGEMPIYCAFRTLPFCEVGVLFFAPVFALISIVLNKQNTKFKTIVLLLFCLGFVSIPFIKPVLQPLNIASFREKWTKDNICLQSTPSTCGPSCLATIMAFYGKDETEKGISKAVFSSLGGTENWYLARYAKTQGLNYRFLKVQDIEEVITPAIIGIKKQSIGHFITIIKVEDGLFYVGDPLNGLSIFSKDDFVSKYNHTGFVLSLWL